MKTGKSESVMKFLAAYALDYPPAFVGKAAEVEAKAGETPLRGMDTVEKWKGKDGISGLCKKLEDQLPHEVEEIQGEINVALGGSPSLHNVCTTLLLQAQVLCQKAFGSPQGLHDYLISSMVGTGELAGETKKKAESDAWRLTLKNFERYWKEVGATHVGARSAHVISDANERASVYMWAALRAYDKAREFDVAAYRNHPSFAADMNMHLFQNRAATHEVEALQARLRLKEADLVRHGKELGTLRSELSKVHEAVKKLQNKK
jgi:hypothetical protein